MSLFYVILKKINNDINLKKGTFHFCYLDFYYELVKLLEKWFKNHKVYKRMHYKTNNILFK